MAEQYDDAGIVVRAAGGVGLLLGQWLAALGATSIGTVGSADKVAVAKAQGYSHVIDNGSEDFVARTQEITGSKGCDVVYDSVGKDTWRGSLNSLKRRGTFAAAAWLWTPKSQGEAERSGSLN